MKSYFRSAFTPAKPSDSAAQASFMDQILQSELGRSVPNSGGHPRKSARRQSFAIESLNSVDEDSGNGLGAYLFEHSITQILDQSVEQPTTFIK